MNVTNLRTNARWLHDYLNIMRWEEPGEFLVDTAGLGTGGALRLGGARFPLALAGALGARAWVKNLLGVETKTIAGIIPREFAEGFDAAVGVAEGATALVLEGISIGGSFLTALQGGNIAGLVAPALAIKGFVEKSVAFVNESIENLEPVVAGLVGLAKDIHSTAVYYGGIVNVILGFGTPRPPRVFEKFVFRTPAEILAELMGPVTDVGSRFVPGDVRPPTIAEQRTFGARESVRRARERVSRGQIVPGRLTIEQAREIARVGVEFQQESFQLGLGMLSRSREGTDVGLLELLREVKGG